MRSKDADTAPLVLLFEMHFSRAFSAAGCLGRAGVLVVFLCVCVAILQLARVEEGLEFGRQQAELVKFLMGYVLLRLGLFVAEIVL